MSQPTRCGTGIGDEFVMILRHLSDPASLPQQRFRERSSAKQRIKSAAGKSTLPRLFFAIFQYAVMLMQDLVRGIIMLLCVSALKLSLQVVTFTGALCKCLCCSRRSGKVGRVTSLHWSLTNAVFQLQAEWKEKKMQQDIVASFLRRHRISSLLKIRAQKHVSTYVGGFGPQQVREKDKDKVRKQSMHLVSEIMEEMGSPPLIEHSFFVSLRSKHLNLLNQLCWEALIPMFKSPSKIVFTVGESCSTMYMIVNGRTQYSAQLPASRDAPAGSAGTQVRKVLQSGQWLSEAALWTGWVHRGEMRTLCECFFLGLDAAKFAKVISSHKSAHAFAAGYARKFVEGLNKNVHSDITEAGPVD